MCYLLKGGHICEGVPVHPKLVPHAARNGGGQMLDCYNGSKEAPSWNAELFLASASRVSCNPDVGLLNLQSINVEYAHIPVDM
jgi:hypothetical protein